MSIQHVRPKQWWRRGKQQHAMCVRCDERQIGGAVEKRSGLFNGLFVLHDRVPRLDGVWLFYTIPLVFKLNLHPPGAPWHTKRTPPILHDRNQNYNLILSLHQLGSHRVIWAPTSWGWGWTELKILGQEHLKMWAHSIFRSHVCPVRIISLKVYKMYLYPLITHLLK